MTILCSLTAITETIQADYGQSVNMPSRRYPMFYISCSGKRHASINAGGTCRHVESSDHSLLPPSSVAKSVQYTVSQTNRT
jgi:hypothetical protein